MSVEGVRELAIEEMGGDERLGGTLVVLDKLDAELEQVQVFIRTLEG